jgi:hypothetical protein
MGTMQMCRRALREQNTKVVCSGEASRNLMRGPVTKKKNSTNIVLIIFIVDKVLCVIII